MIHKRQWILFWFDCPTKKTKKYKSLARDSNGTMEVSQETTEEKLLLVIELL